MYERYLIFIYVPIGEDTTLVVHIYSLKLMQVVLSPQLSRVGQHGEAGITQRGPWDGRIVLHLRRI